jgi:hypothetical protein
MKLATTVITHGVRKIRTVIITARLRRATMCVAGSAAVSLGVLMAAAPVQAHVHAPAASQSARFAAAATPHQNTVIGKAMTQRPDGTRISPGEVTWPDGVRLRVSATVTASCPPVYYCGCPAGYFCAYPTAFNGAWYLVENYKLAGGTYFFPWGECSPTQEPGCDVGIHSWASNTGYRTWLEQNINSGNELCISNRTNNLNYNGNSDLDYWIYLSSNSAAC